jgi:hypothetical protein
MAMRGTVTGDLRAGMLGLFVGLPLGLVGASVFHGASTPEDTFRVPALPFVGRARTPAPCSQVEREAERVRAEIALRLQTMEEVRTRVEGLPIPWSAARGEQYMPDAFEQAMAEAEADCPDVDILRVDCEEPPCFAWVQPPPSDPWDARARVAADSALTRCPAWRSRYGGFTAASFDVVCDETVVHGVVLGTPPGWTFGDVDPEFDANVAKRIRTRNAAAIESWPCPTELSP